MDVTIRQLKAFLEIANVRNFRIASTNLGMSQPSLSALLKDLERTLGTPLFTRTTRQVSLTSEGGSNIALVVEDDGIGWTGTGTVRGTGLGSRVIKAMARSLGGELVYATAAIGTRAVLRFQG